MFYLALIVLLIIIFILLLKFFKIVLKLVLVILLIFVVLSVTLGYFVYKDVSDLRTNLLNSENLVLLTDQEQILAGVSIIKSANDYVLLSQKDVKRLSENKDLNSYFTKYYKIIFIDIKLIEKNLPDKINVQNTELSKEQIISTLKSSDPLKEIQNPNIIRLLEKETKIKGFNSEDPTHIKILISFATLQDIISLEPQKLIEEYQQGSIIIYKETIGCGYTRNIGGILENIFLKIYN